MLSAGGAPLHGAAFARYDSMTAMRSFASRGGPAAWGGVQVRGVAGVACAMVMGATAACEEPPIPTFDVVIHVDSDPGVPLAGAVLSREGKDVSTTDAMGRA